ncbi:MAG: hypothetical protein M1816_006655 [Peltula sp. TS41687]|nr:MAG: hypothetical protein M1816_006655 [Peltula sp. TS41687]
MSSMRNALPRRNHAERAQPTERSKWGLLEKHKDYALRAADYRAKKARLRTLRSKAANRNPDEFYFGMMSARMSAKEGVRLGDRGNKVLSQETARLLKTQDAGYLRLAGQKVRREVEGLEGGFLFRTKEGRVDVCGEEDEERERGGVGWKKVVFVGSREEQKLRAVGLVESEKGRGQEGDEEEEEEEEREEDREQRKITRAWERRKSKLDAARQRQKQVEAAERELELQRARMAKHPSVGGVNKWGVKWKVRERKR